MMTRISFPGSAHDHPFKVNVRRKEGSLVAFEAQVITNSFLLTNFAPTSYQTIVGLGTWFNLIANDIIWLDAAIAAGVVTAASIKSRGQGSSDFDPSAAPYTTNSCMEATSLIQTKARVLIAWTNAGTGPTSLTQSCFNHLMMRSFCLQTISTIFPEPSPYGAYTN